MSDKSNTQDDANPFEGFEGESFSNGELTGKFSSVPLVDDSDEDDTPPAGSANSNAGDDDPGDGEAEGADDGGAEGDDGEADDPLAEFSDDPGDDDDDSEDDEDEEDDDDADDDSEDDDDAPDRLQQRFDALTARRRKAERRAEAAERRAEEEAQARAALEARIAALEKGDKADEGDGEDDKSPAAPEIKVLDANGKPLKEPDPADYDYGDIDPRYQADVRTYDRALIRAELKAEKEAEQQASTAQQEAEKVGQAWAKLGETGESRYKDFSEKVLMGAQEGKWALSQQLAQLIPSSDVGADIAYHLASNPLESKRVAGLPPVEQARYFGRLEAAMHAKLKKGKQQKAKQPGAAKPPRQKQPRGSGGRFANPAASSDFAAFEASQKDKKR